MGENNQGEGNKNSRKVGVAIGLSILAPGLGQVYCGHLIRGVVFLCLLTIVGLGKDIMLLFVINQPQSSIATVYIIWLLFLSFYGLATVDSERLVRKHGEDFEPKKYNKWYVYVIVIGIVFFVIRPMFFHGYIVQAYRIPTKSMMPTINEGNGIFVDKLTYDRTNARRGDVVVYKQPDIPRVRHVGRIIGLPGETIEIRDKGVFIDGILLRESYTFYWDLENRVGRAYLNRDNLEPTQIPTGHYFVMGDNRDFSVDSRLWGFLPQDLIEGKVERIYYSGDRVVWQKIENPVYK